MIDGDSLLLQQLPYFRNFRPEELALVRSQVRPRNLAADEVILLEGQPAEALYVVCRGRVRIFQSTAAGREQVLFMLGRGATFDDVAAFDGGANLANAQACGTGASVNVLPVTFLRHLVVSNPCMAANVAGVLAERVRQLVTLVADLSLHHTIQRVAKLLMEESAGTGVVLVSRQEMATRIGTVREMVSRALCRLEQTGAVSRRDNRTLHVETRMLHAYLDADPASDDHLTAVHGPRCSQPIAVVWPDSTGRDKPTL